MSLFTLLRWLGPWTNQKRVPNGVQRDEIETHDQDFRLWVYDTPRSKGALYIVPGLHHEGPEDPRLDRFARVLAKAGITVGVPFLPTSMGLVMKPDLCTEAQKGFQAFQEHIKKKSGVFGISAASIGALAIASNEQNQGSLSGVMLFGGFSNWQEALLFAASDDDILAKDPLNIPVIFINLWEHINIPVQDEALLLQSWKKFIHQTWEKEDMQSIEKHSVVAFQLAEQVHHDDRNIFLQGTSVEPGGDEIIKEVLKNGLHGYDWLNPEPHLENLCAPLFLTHGRDDVVVPYLQTYELQSKAPPHTPAYITGFYDHTGLTSFRRLLSLIPRIPQEVFHSILLLRAIIFISRGKKK
ncbi:MAG: hypothetical protein CL916_09870 [Deltaproteobacteria bacterium]|nr:hypothetical protein [Deltaproteobacteria bacterium]